MKPIRVKPQPLFPEELERLSNSEPSPPKPTSDLDIFFQGCDGFSSRLSDEEIVECKQLHQEYNNSIKKANCKCKHKGIRAKYSNRLQKLLNNPTSK